MASYWAAIAVSEESLLGKQMGSKLMSAKEAVERFVFDGATIGMGGQSIGRCSMVLAHEIVRQGKKDLTLVGCNLSMSMDIMVGAGLVKKTENGTGSLERFGTAFRWRDAIEQGRIEPCRPSRFRLPPDQQK